MSCLFHKWNGCKCEKCGNTRDSHHRLLKIENICMEKCEICGYEKTVNHKFQDGICSCGVYQSFVGYYLVGEKPDLSKKEDNLTDLFKQYSLEKAFQNNAKNSWQNWNDTTISIGFSTEYQIFFNSVNELTAKNPYFAEKVKSLGELTTDIKKERLFYGSRGVVENLSTDFIIELNKYFNDNKDIVLEGDVYYTSGNERFTQPSQISYSYLPKWKIAIFFFHKKQKDAVVCFEPFRGSGICDVCNKSLRGVVSYIVPNAVFYNSPRYRVFFRKNLCAFTSKDVSDEMANQMFTEMQAKDTKSQGSAVCENCIYMF